MFVFIRNYVVNLSDSNKINCLLQCSFYIFLNLQIIKKIEFLVSSDGVKTVEKSYSNLCRNSVPSLPPKN
jgi:hypothetical protein